MFGGEAGQCWPSVEAMENIREACWWWLPWLLSQLQRLGRRIVGIDSQGGQLCRLAFRGRASLADQPKKCVNERTEGGRKKCKVRNEGL